jgi:Ni/Co efflux regulator RcnB
MIRTARLQVSGELLLPFSLQSGAWRDTAFRPGLLGSPQEMTMKASLPVMFILPLLAAAAAQAGPQEHGSRYQSNGDARHGHDADRGDRQNSQPTNRADPRYPGNPAYSQRPAESRQPDRGVAPANPRGSGWGGIRQFQTDNGAQRRDYRNAPPSRDAGRDHGYTAQRPSVDQNRSPRTDRPDHNYGDNRDQRSRYDNNRYDRPGNDRYQGRDEHRQAGWSHDRDHGRDDQGRTWHHDRDWYDNYRADHFSYYDNRYYARQRFSIGFYSAPWGYRTRLWGYGDRLPLAYYDGRYVIDNYYDYDLYAPPFATEWVRVGNDVLLIDMQDGQVLDVIADLFW